MKEVIKDYEFNQLNDYYYQYEDEGINVELFMIRDECVVRVETFERYEDNTITIHKCKNVKELREYLSKIIDFMWGVNNET